MFARKKLKRQDFLLENGWFETLTRRPGELQMQQFQISDCEECQIFLFDSAACVYIDECKYCTVFVGACEASVFVRDCVYTTVICSTQQFRVRDCVDCHFSLCCESQPIIESSKGIQISNFPLFGYSQLLDQMQSAKTTPWNNNWFDVYDFTPDKFKSQNFTLRELEPAKKKEVMGAIRSKMKELGLKESQPIVPRIIGRKEFPLNQIAVLVAYPVPPPIASSQYQLIQSRVHNLCQQQLAALGLTLTCQGRTKLLFVKVFRKDLQLWKQVLKNIISQKQKQQILTLYESTVFAPFKDEH